MSIVGPKKTRLQQFFRSGPMPCPYLDGLVERKLFTRIRGQDAARVNSELTRAGFRRSHDIVYKPSCPGCNACVPVRIPAARFTPNRTQRRIWRRNEDLTAQFCPALPTVEQYRLFSRYQRSRHGDSDMARMTMADFDAMVRDGRCDTHVIEFRDQQGTLLATLLVDRLTDGYSAVYSFFEPEQHARSPGTFMISWLVEWTRLEGLENVYLGYWIPQSRKMAYKSRFSPIEQLTPDGWRDLDANTDTASGDPGSA